MRKRRPIQNCVIGNCQLHSAAVCDPKYLRRIDRASNDPFDFRECIARPTRGFRNQRQGAPGPLGLFDDRWYVANNPEERRGLRAVPCAVSREGARALRDPNPYFGAAWYCAENPGARENPLVHYLTRGAAAGLRPSPAFDPAWYHAAYPDVAAAGVEPLAHFLRRGKDAASPREPDDFQSAQAADLLCLKRPAPRDSMALFVTHAPGRRIKPHVLPFLRH